MVQYKTSLWIDNASVEKHSQQLNPTLPVPLLIIMSSSILLQTSLRCPGPIGLNSPRAWVDVNTSTLWKASW